MGKKRKTRQRRAHRQEDARRKRFRRQGLVAFVSGWLSWLIAGIKGIWFWFLDSLKGLFSRSFQVGSYVLKQIKPMAVVLAEGFSKTWGERGLVFVLLMLVLAHLVFGCFVFSFIDYFWGESAPVYEPKTFESDEFGHLEIEHDFDYSFNLNTRPKVIGYRPTTFVTADVINPHVSPVIVNGFQEQTHLGIYGRPVIPSGEFSFDSSAIAFDCSSCSNYLVFRFDSLNQQTFEVTEVLSEPIRLSRLFVFVTTLGIVLLFALSTLFITIWTSHKQQ